jgi:uncharacterized protein
VPGWKLLVDVMKLAGPCIILLDEALDADGERARDETVKAFHTISIGKTPPNFLPRPSTTRSRSFGRFDPAFGYADRFDEATGTYPGLVWAKSPPELISSSAVIVRSDVAFEHQRSKDAESQFPMSAGAGNQVGGRDGAIGNLAGTGDGTTNSRQPRRFYGSVEIDLNRPVKSFDAVLNAVVTELLRTQGAKVKLTLEIEAEAPAGFAEGDIGIVRDNARQLKFKAESTGFED